MVQGMDQVHRMLNMRIKIDVWSQGREENKRQDIREKLRDLFCQLPARRLWYYLKELRTMLSREPGDIPDLDEMQEYMKGPEDVIVKGKCPVLFHFSIN